jgi:DNA-binding response OmpR family regulator
MLYIEDDDDTREQMSGILKLYTKQLIVASNGMDAIDICSKHDVQLIITDLEMPKLNGIDFIKKFRQNNIHTPIIVTTAFATSDYLLSCANLSIQGYILKPFTQERIKKTLKNAIRYIRENLYFNLGHKLMYDKGTRTIIKNSQEYKLTNEEKLLLDLLLKNKNRVTTYNEIEAEIWVQHNKTMSETALRTLVKKLRQKCNKNTIKNISGSGYTIVIEN